MTAGSKTNAELEMMAAIRMFGVKSEEEEEEDRLREERYAKIDAYLESLDPK